MTNRIEKLLEGTTPGPWKYKKYEDDDCKKGYTRYIDVGNGHGSIMCDMDHYSWFPKNDQDWELIAAAPTIIRELHEHAQKMRDALEYAHSQMQPFCDDAKVKGVLAAYDAWMKGELDD